MTYAKSSYLNFHFILIKSVYQAKNIQKTIIFVSTIIEIKPMINIIKAWTIKKKYLLESYLWIKAYYFTFSKQNKVITPIAFCIFGSKNLECSILVIINTYIMGINNLYI